MASKDAVSGSVLGSVPFYQGGETTSVSQFSINKYVTGKSAHPALSTRKKFFSGLIIVCIIACSWVGSTQTSKSSYAGSFKAPFFSVWFGTAWMVSLFPLTAPLYFLVEKRSAKDLWR